VVPLPVEMIGSLGRALDRATSAASEPRV